MCADDDDWRNEDQQWEVHAYLHDNPLLIKTQYPRISLRVRHSILALAVHLQLQHRPWLVSPTDYIYDSKLERGFKNGVDLAGRVRPPVLFTGVSLSGELVWSEDGVPREVKWPAAGWVPGDD